MSSESSYELSYGLSSGLFGLDFEEQSCDSFTFKVRVSGLTQEETVSLFSSALCGGHIDAGDGGYRSYIYCPASKQDCFVVESRSQTPIRDFSVARLMTFGVAFRAIRLICDLSQFTVPDEYVFFEWTPSSDVEDKEEVEEKVEEDDSTWFHFPSLARVVQGLSGCHPDYVVLTPGQLSVPLDRIDVGKIIGPRGEYIKNIIREYGGPDVKLAVWIDNANPRATEDPVLVLTTSDGCETHMMSALCACLVSAC